MWRKRQVKICSSFCLSVQSKQTLTVNYAYLNKDLLFILDEDVFLLNELLHYHLSDTNVNTCLDRKDNKSCFLGVNISRGKIATWTTKPDSSHAGHFLAVHLMNAWAGTGCEEETWRWSHEDYRTFYLDPPICSNSALGPCLLWINDHLRKEFVMFRFTVRKFIMLQESVVVPCNQTRLKHCFIVTGAWSHPDLLYFISRSCNKTLRLQGCRTSSEYIQNLLGSYVPTVKETHSFLAGIRVKPYSVANS